MRKDIFIDNNIASKFCNPMDPHYKELIRWLMNNHKMHEFEDDRAYLMVSNKLLREYNRSCYLAKSSTAIPTIIGQLTKEGRLIKISNKEIEDFKREHFTRKIIKKLQSNVEDRDHIPVVMLSERKYALVRDHNFAIDLCSFPGYKVWVCHRPEELPYK